MTKSVRQADLDRALRSASRGRLTFLETGQGRPRTANGFGNWFAKACAMAGVERRAHGLRHMMGVDAAENGASSRAIGSILGHDDPKQSDRYGVQADKRRMAEQTMRAVEAARLENIAGTDGKHIEIIDKNRAMASRREVREPK